VSGHRDFIDGELTRAPPRTFAAFHSSFTNLILLVDRQIDLGRGLVSHLTRHGFRAELAITVDTARSRRRRVPAGTLSILGPAFSPRVIVALERTV
jgi:hypothetical protein